MRIYTIQKLIVHSRNGMFSYFEIKNTLDIIRIVDNNYDELVSKYKSLHHITYLNTRLIFNDESLESSNPKEFFTNGIYKKEEDGDDYYLISFVDV